MSAPRAALPAVSVSASGAAAVRLHQIDHLRRRVLVHGEHNVLPAGRAWLEQSWQRSLSVGHQPHSRMVFDSVSSPERKRLLEAQRGLLAAAHGVLADTARAVAPLGFFVLLTDAQGVVLQVAGAVDTRDPRARAIGRVGLDLSERRVGTTAIGAALASRQAVWLHRTEHFYAEAGCYSCAGAPLAGPRGELLGMLDVTGIDAQERPELAHLVAQAAQRVEAQVLLAQPHRWRVSLAWPGASAVDAATAALLLVDDDGQVTGADTQARTMLGLSDGERPPSHLSAVLAEPWEALLDGVEHEAVLWSGLRMRLRADDSRDSRAPARAAPSAAVAKTTAKPLKAHQREWIRQAVTQARGNVSAAALSLGISRATVYRVLGKTPPESPH